MAGKATKEQAASLLSNTLAIVGFIIIIVVAIWGLLNIAVISKPWFASFFSSQDNSSNFLDETSFTILPYAVITKDADTKPLANTVAGLPDLNVQILSSGVIDPVSGSIVPRRTTSSSDLVAVRFNIVNDGVAPTGTWYFTAELPTLPSFIYTSNAQDSLAPGAHIESTLRFAQVPSSGGIFTVSVDPSNLVRESNENNNTASASI